MQSVIIIGSGLIGASMAIALARLGLAVELIDATPADKRLQPTYDGRTSAVALGSMRVLRHLGVWQRITDSEPIRDIRVCDEGGRFYVHYDHMQAGGEPFGHIVENRLLRGALYEALDELPAITLHQPVRAENIASDETGVTVRLTNGATVRGALLLVADGKFSTTREQLAIDATVLSYGQTAIVCTLRHSAPHGGLAVEKFMPSGPFALLPMTGQRSNVVWSEHDALAARMLELDDAAFLHEVRRRVGDYLGELELVGPRYAYPLTLVHARNYTLPRIALIGDAAHGIHPIAGQGANLGFRDVAALTELIERHARLGLDLGSADLLAHYARWRRFDVMSMTAVTDALNRLFSNSILPLRLARDVGMGLVERSAPAKRFLMQHAMGLVGDLPEMMKETS